MTYSLSNNCTKNYYNRPLTVQVIVEDVVTWIFLRQCIYIYSPCWRGSPWNWSQKKLEWWGLQTVKNVLR